MKEGPIASNLSPALATKEGVRLDNQIKQYTLIAGLLATVGFVAVFGPTALYVVLGITGVGAYALYPEKMDKFYENHEWALLAAGIVSILWGPIAGILGAVVGNFASKKYQQVSEQVEKVTHVVNTVTAPIVAVGNAPSSIWNGLKNAVDYSTGKLNELAVFLWADDEDEFGNPKPILPSSAVPAVVIPEMPRASTSESVEQIREQALAPNPQVVQFQAQHSEQTLTVIPDAANDGKKEENSSSWWESFRKNPMGLM